MQTLKTTYSNPHYRFNPPASFACIRASGKPKRSEGHDKLHWQLRLRELDPDLSEAKAFAPLKNKLSCKKTGNYYYGARYYDPKSSVWLSVDPLAHKYPSLSPYVFSADNPIMVLDPDGAGRIIIVSLIRFKQ